MKAIFLIGGFSGFVTGAATSLWAGHEPDRIFLDAAVGCLAGGLLFRWFWTVLVRGIRETLLQRQAAALATAKTK
jgi:hypothetical protein